MRRCCAAWKPPRGIIDQWFTRTDRTQCLTLPSSAPESAAPISLRGRDFRFRPDSGVFETIAGRSQFGLTRDDWGRRFLSWNTIPVRHEVIPDAYLARNPKGKVPALAIDGEVVHVGTVPSVEDVKRLLA